jgi:hypothetical protein
MMQYRYPVLRRTCNRLGNHFGWTQWNPRWVGQVEANFRPFRDCVNLDVMHGLRRTYNSLRNHFGHAQWYSYVTWVKWKHILVHLETMLISMQDRCMVSAECSMRMEIFLGTQWNSLVTCVTYKLGLVHLEIVLMSAWDRCMACNECTTGIGIILGAPDGTPGWRGSSWNLFQSVWR